GPVTALAGVHPNTAEASGTYNSTTVTDQSTAVYRTSNVTVTKKLTAESGSVANVAEPGETLTYTITFTNSGGSALNIAAGALEDTVPANTTHVGGDDFTCTPDDTAGSTCSNTNAINVPARVGTTDGTASVTFTVQVAADLTGVSSITNTITTFPPQTSCADSTSCTVVTPNAVVNVSLDKQVDDSTPNVGATVTFTLTIANAGPSAATNIDVTDVLPSGYTYVAASIAGGDTRNDSSPSVTGLTWTINSLASGGSVDLTYQATVLASGDYDNYAQIMNHDQPDSNSIPGNNSTTEDDDDIVTVTPNAVADLSLTKTVNNSSPVIGNNVTFTLTLTNDGPSNATAVSVSDLLPAGLIYVSDTSAITSVASTYASGTGIWTITGTLNSGSSVSLDITATLTQPGDITNT
ncbi:MAG: DUF11 domain-containing protein, partial [Gammaproteobacteria bacterium]|nr:DUF11 domain-containing protein [Gammaproteobacteria bacterium]